MTEQQNTDAVTAYLTADADHAEAVESFLAAEAAYVATLASVEVAKAIGPTLSCQKVSLIADMLKKAGHAEKADWWLYAHSAEGTIDEFDPHYEDWKEGEPWR